MRDAESRTRFLGWRAENVKLFAFTVSAVMAGIAGALYVPQVGIINPGEFEPGNSIEVVIWTAVGGRATIVGPIVGAVLVNAGKILVHRRAAGVLAVRARRPVRRRHAVPAQGHRRPVGPVANRCRERVVPLEQGHRPSEAAPPAVIVRAASDKSTGWLEPHSPGAPEPQPAE